MPADYVYDVQQPTEQSVKEAAFAAMTELEGWCTNKKATTLMNLVFLTRPQVIVEIGVFGGKSLVPMAYALKHLGSGIVYGIDPWAASESLVGQTEEANREWWGKIDHEAIYRGLVSKVKQFNLQKHVQLLKTSSARAPAIPNIDILHIDGNHSEETSVFDVLKWVPLVRKGGIIIFDDLDWVTTKKAAAFLDDYGTKFLQESDNNVWGVWIKN